jgi:hypothetical protein
MEAMISVFMRAMEFFYIQVQWQSVRLDDQAPAKAVRLR